jgi:septum formation protein
VIEFVVLKNDPKRSFFYPLTMKEFILASKSPRRKALLRNLIETFLIINPEIQEVRREGESPRSYVKRNSALKAEVLEKKIQSLPAGEWVVIAADTIVVDGDRILGKPEDQSQATQMLTRLRGRTHTVYSGLAVYDISRKEIQTRQVSSQVAMREYTDEELKEYVASGDPMDKAGAYAIQNRQFDPAPAFGDCYANVMGLPLCDLAVLLHQMNCPILTDVADRCQKSIQYQCPIFPEKLSGISGKEKE